jgi:hypothetical protein
MSTTTKTDYKTIHYEMEKIRAAELLKASRYHLAESQKIIRTMKERQEKNGIAAELREREVRVSGTPEVSFTDIATKIINRKWAEAQEKKKNQK